MFLHDRELRTHGNLKSSNCVVNSRWTLQVTDFGLPELRQRAEAELSEYVRYRSTWGHGRNKNRDKTHDRSKINLT